MPTISMFYGIIIRMYYDDHNPPHFHAYYGDYKAMFDFNANLIQGDFPQNQFKLIQAWTLLHKDELSANWKLSKNNEQLFYINPLH